MASFNRIAALDTKPAQPLKSPSSPSTHQDSTVLGEHSWSLLQGGWTPNDKNELSLSESSRQFYQGILDASPLPSSGCGEDENSTLTDTQQAQNEGNCDVSGNVSQVLRVIELEALLAASEICDHAEHDTNSHALDSSTCPTPKTPLILSSWHGLADGRTSPVDQSVACREGIELT
eukprot:SAG31_NODE_17019_length_686_cov_1.229983_1_plen_175_part_10